MKLQMLKFIPLAAFVFLSASARASTFQVTGTDAAPWTKILQSIGMTASQSSPALSVVGPNAHVDVSKLSQDHIVIVEGTGTTAKQIGITTNTGFVTVRQIRDIHAPKMQIFWEQALNVPAVVLPTGFQVFATEKWKGIPVLAGKRTAHGAILWIASSPGPAGIERYPYILQALVDLGFTTPAQTTDLWAFFDSSYRIRADVDYLARRWRQAGVGVLHVAAWHNVEPDPIQDEFLRKLIEACHKNAILVYAWLELPHVSEKFWADHPEWREKTAAGQDAELDWRKLMNLQNPDCHRAVQKEVTQLLREFDWDGVNVAELYFESLEGASNPARFTPMNDDVRAAFKKADGFDPKLLFDPSSPYSKNPQALRKFLDFRAQLASRMQADWLDVIDGVRTSKPYLDIVLTHIDDRFEPGIRDALGADVARSLPLIQARHSTLLVEDPATLWDLGPERYAKLGEKYSELSKDHAQFAIDINVVERYQEDAYPTKKQTGIELFQQVHQAAESFSHVALYFENSLEKQDLPLLAAAGSTTKVTNVAVDEMKIESQEPTRISWQGPVDVDGSLWPVQNNTSVLAPAGVHTLSPAAQKSRIAITDFNGFIKAGDASRDMAEVSYSSRSRAIAMLGTPVAMIDLDGAPFWRATGASKQGAIMLPPGEHVVTFHALTISENVVNCPPRDRNCSINARSSAADKLLIASETSSTRAPVSSSPNAAQRTQSSVTTP